MYDKLTKIIAAYEALETKLGDPAVLADQKEYTRLAKEHARQGELATAAREYIADNFSPEYLPETPNVFKCRKNAQDAH